MARITCKTPSTGSPVSARIVGVGTGWTTVTGAEAPDFSVSDPNSVYPDRDPLDASRAIRPGEVFLLTPLSAHNKTATTRWLEVRLYDEANVACMYGKVSVPAYETVAVPVQGRSLLKRDMSSVNGDRLQVRAETAATFDVWIAGEEKLSSEHIGVV